MGPGDVHQVLAESRRDGRWEDGLRYVADESLDQGRRVTRDDWRRKWAGMMAGCPDLEITVEHTVVDGEWAANRCTMRGTHTGELFGRPPTGERFEFRGIDMIRVRDGQIVEHWGFAEGF
ncbi:hypothetical protein GCM10009765_47440 [Fodinicola feengrottensis]|uniref:Ester cyclase n=1 Tax=Fodinicola feengrottensis TaxID=435914 RepID=A0ABN2HS70_9ACTN